MMTPKWFQLIQAHCEHNGVALSIPFLVGSLRGPQDKSPMSPTKAISHVSALLQSFKTETPDGSIVRVYRCTNLGNQPFAQILKSNEKLPPDTLFPSDLISIADHAEQIYEYFAADMCAARFSYQSKSQSYEHFTPHDIEFIECTLN